ncbi:MAG: M16 family metallopeptidase [Burkholderiaceae bacterium]|jgi:zinc protease
MNEHFLCRAPFPGGIVRAVWATVVLLAATAAQAALPIETWSTPSGAKVMFMRAAAIPMLDIQIDLDAGARRDSAELSGLASMTALLLNKGIAGPRPRNEAQIADALADIGAAMGASASDDRASVGLRTLTSAPELDRALELLADAVQYPSFPADVLDREKQRAISAIREDATKPEAIARRTFAQLMYGTHPYGFEPTEESMARIDATAVQAFYRQFYGPGRVVVSLVGNIDRAQAETIASRLTANLPQPTAPLPELPAVQLPVAKVVRINHPASQSHVLAGLPALARGDPDFFPLLVGNYVLGGGGFASRLMSEVREKRGLAYGAHAYFLPLRQLGPFQLGLQTKREQTDQAIKVARDTLEQFLREGPTAAELTAAKQNLIGGFPLRIDSNKKLLEQIAVIGFYDFPTDYLDQWADKVQQVTLPQIRAAFARHVPLEHLVTVIVGQ